MKIGKSFICLYTGGLNPSKFEANKGIVFSLSVLGNKLGA